MRPLPAVALALALAPAATAAPPSVQLAASPRVGMAPLEATFVAQGDAASYRWEINGSPAGEGPTLRHVFAAGHHQVTLVAASAGGEETRESVTVSAFSLSLAAPRVASYGQAVTFRGRIVPAIPGAPVVLERGGRVIARTRVGRRGYVVRARASTPATYLVRVDDLASGPVHVSVRPRLLVSVAGPRLAGRPFVVRAAVRPTRAGSVRVNAGGLTRTASGRVALRVSTRRQGSYRVRVRALPAAGWSGVSTTLSVRVHLPRLVPGSRGASVAELERGLAGLGYALRAVDRFYGSDTTQAVLAFQKVHGLPWTGRVTPRLWRVLASASTPRARYPRGNHVEVDKSRQLLLLVRDGRVVLVTHVSTGATGNTPVGRWRVYRKVTGWDWILWYPMYFLRGFAIHGYPSVPAYPASHGCVRVPMWLAPRLYRQNGYGTLVYVY